VQVARFLGAYIALQCNIMTLHSKVNTIYSKTLDQKIKTVAMTAFCRVLEHQHVSGAKEPFKIRALSKETEQFR